MSSSPAKPATPAGQKTYAVNNTTLGFEPDSLVLYLYDHVPKFVAPLRIEKFALGQSNPTFFLVDGREQKYVLRKKPAGALLSPTAHAVEREFQVLNALGNAGKVPVPRVFTLCTDTNVIGTPFYIMDFVKGRIFPNALLPELPKEQRKDYWKAAIKTLAALHKTDLKATGLDKFGPPRGYYARQLKTLMKVSAAQAQVKNAKGEAVGPMPGVAALKEWFEKNMPADETTLVHGDFKFDNLIFHPTEPKVIGILDWELATLGHPLSDLANLLMCYFSTDMAVGSFTGVKGREREQGMLTLRECLDLYAAEVGRPQLKDLQFPAAFVYFKFSTITQGIKARLFRGQASSKEAATMAGLFEPCAKTALQITMGSSSKL
ncbi:hypothetical protein AMAG_00872 [Allomyces macrogynus ATCC 38327]|uniref:Aminoglycoside phosphotransferase domain-containing protein n=1 Tax=Allomyces macrogynus (strain ATCC 38327) TaxID=578462 RepID=A0A0L0RXU9_ALLM3|nr:hypothetical protein AMAG_00872 [Allomyces macrogynus ATCC 38327]|eukprot:KNE54929.1 hypothetical protein AMAG_00872 [Allomyces macrogynus ATCC 38327]